MNQLKKTFAIIVALIIFFVFVDRMEFNCCAFEAEPVAEDSSFEKSVEAQFVLGSKSAAEKKLTVEAPTVEVMQSSAISKSSPVAVPVITVEEAVKANEDALKLHLQKETIAKTEGSKTVAESITENKLAPMAVPVLTAEEAIKANKKAIRLQEEIKNKRRITSFVSFFKKFSPLLFVIMLVFVSDFFVKDRNAGHKKQESFLKRGYVVITSVSLFLFGLMVFVPWSVYFGNSTDFSFIFSDFVGWNVMILFLLIIVLSGLLIAIPSYLSKWIITLFVGLGLCFYFQSMFMNCYIGLMNGLEPEWGQHSSWGIINLLIWIAIIIMPFIVNRFFKSHWPTVMVLVSVILVMEIVAAISLVCAAPQNLWKRTEECTCDGSNQFQFSKEKNIIVLFFDALSCELTQFAFETDPKLKETMKDFTWYEEARSNYNNTFLSLSHEMTGCMDQPAKDLNDMFVNIWQSPSAKSFYKQIKDAGYESRLYVKTTQIGLYDNFEEYFSNVSKRKADYKINSAKLHQCLYKISAFSAFPYLLKRFFFYGDDFSNEVVERIELSENSAVYSTNDKYYTKLVKNGITCDAESPIFSFHYTRGAHPPWQTDEECKYHSTPLDSFLPPARGCYYLVSNLISRLKENNIYDKTAIIICSDHGQYILDKSGKEISTSHRMTFMVKPFYANNDKILLDSSKVLSVDLVPTIIQLACGEQNADYSSFEGFPPSSIPSNRHRILFTSGLSSAFPDFMGYNGNTHTTNYLSVKDMETGHSYNMPLSKSNTTDEPDSTQSN